MSEDPIGFKAGDRNLYRYCGGDPVNKTDPMGLYDVGFEGYGAWGDDGPTRNTVGNAALRDEMEARGGRSFGREKGGGRGQREALKGVRQALSQNPREPINVAGYSRGADAAVQFARSLGKDGVPVDRLTLIDPVKKLGSLRYPVGGAQHLTVPANVKQADNYYQTIRTPFAGGAITNASANYRNHDVTSWGVDHNTIVKAAFNDQNKQNNQSRQNQKSTSVADSSTITAAILEASVVAWELDDYSGGAASQRPAPASSP